VERLEDGDQVERALRGEVGGVADHERDAVGHPGLGRGRAGAGDRGLVQVGPEDRRPRVDAGQRHRRRPKAAAQVEHPRRRCRAEPLVEVGHGRQPGRGQLVEEHLPVGGRDAVAHPPAVVGIGHPAAAAVGPDQLGQHAGNAGEGQRQRGGMVGAVGVHQHLGVAVGQPVAALGRRQGRVVAGQVAGDRLLLEPLAGVPGRDAGPPGDLGLGRPPEVGQGPVEAQLDAEVHAQGLHRPGQPVDQPLREHLPRIHIGRHRHGPSLLSRARRGPSPPAAWPLALSAGVQPAYSRPSAEAGRDAMMPR
jgi:hypothetical protein